MKRILLKVEMIGAIRTGKFVTESFCPLIKDNCRGDKCMWFVDDIHHGDGSGVCAMGILGEAIYCMDTGPGDYE